MKQMIQKLILISGLVGLAIPIQAKTYSDVKLVEVIGKNPRQYGQSKYLSDIERYLEMGADVNQLMPNQKTILVEMIDRLAQDGKAVCEGSRVIKQDLKVGGAALLFSVPALIYCAIERSTGWLQDIGMVRNMLGTVVGTITLLSGVYYLGKCTKNTFADGIPMSNMTERVEALKLLLKHPSIDVEAKNSQGKTVFDVLNGHLEELKKFEKDDTCIANRVRFYAKYLNEVYALLKTKKLEMPMGVLVS